MRAPGTYRQTLRRVGGDLRAGRHLEAYGASAFAIALTVFNLLGSSSPRLTDSVVLACLAFLVLWTTGARGGEAAASLDTVLRNRESFGNFADLLDGASELWMYAPTGVNVLLRHAADIGRWAARGGRARIVVQDPAVAGVDDVRAQLDDHTDFDTSLGASLATLSKLASSGGVEVRLLPFNPGFSMVVVDPRGRAGRLIVEFHGFRDENIAERMHVLIQRSESLHWFEYWTGRFEAIWEAAYGQADNQAAGRQRTR
jgi:hypothetical protein